MATEEINVQELGAPIPETKEMAELEITKWRGTKAYTEFTHPFHKHVTERMERLYPVAYPETPGREKVAGTEEAAIFDALIAEYGTPEKVEEAGEEFRQKLQDEREESEIQKTENHLKAMWGSDTEKRVEDVKALLKGFLPEEDWDEIIHSDIGNDVTFISMIDQVITYLRSKGRVFSKMMEE
jgi:hypothetical protein